MKECKLNILEPVLLAILITAIVSQLVAYGFFLILLSGGVAEGVVFAQHFRAARIPSPWCSMNILLYCYVIYAQGLGLKALSIHSLITGSSSWCVFIFRVFILPYKQEQSAPALEIISGWLLMILKIDCV